MEGIKRLENSVLKLVDEFEKLKKRNEELEGILKEIKEKGASVKTKKMEEEIEKLKQDRELLRGKVQEILSKLKRSEV